MSAKQIYKTMVSTAETLSIEELKLQVAKYMNEFSDEAGTMFNVMLTALENKMPEAEYTDFCNSL